MKKNKPLSYARKLVKLYEKKYPTLTFTEIFTLITEDLKDFEKENKNE